MKDYKKKVKEKIKTQKESGFNRPRSETIDKLPEIIKKAGLEGKPLTKENYLILEDKIREENGLYESDIDNILQKTQRESRTIQEGLAKAQTLLEEYHKCPTCENSYENCSPKIYLLQTASPEILVNFADNNDVIKDNPAKKIAKNKMHDTKKGTFVPIPGSDAVAKEIDFPKKGNVLGALYSCENIANDKHKLDYLVQFAENLGAAMHEGYKDSFLEETVKEKEVSEKKLQKFYKTAFHDLLSVVALSGAYAKRISDGKYPDPQKRKKAEDLVYNNILRAERVIKKIRTEAAIQKGELELKLDLINPYEIAQEVLETYKDQIESEGYQVNQIHKGLPKEGSEMFGDGDSIFTVFDILIPNAIKYGDGGRIEIGHDDLIDVQRYHVFSTGKPISLEDQKILFELEKRGKYTLDKEGTGVGLYSAKIIVEKHGGKIWYEAVPGGNDFVFEIPSIPK